MERDVIFNILIHLSRGLRTPFARSNPRDTPRHQLRDTGAYATRDTRNRAIHIALYGRVRCRGRGHDIVGSHDIVGGLTISWWYDIVSPSTISAREYDIVPQRFLHLDLPN